MIVGNGMMANAFKNVYDKSSDVVIFASGVSNSKTNEMSEFDREMRLLMETQKKNNFKSYKLIYFSTCSILDSSMSESKYVQHKLNTERYIQNNFKNYLIIRLSNVVGVSNNNNTIFNFFVHSVLEGRYFDLWKRSERNLIDIDDAFVIINDLIRHIDNDIVNVANTYNQNVYDLVVLMENYFHKTANYSLIDTGTSYKIPLNKIENIIIDNKIDFSNNYSTKLLKKYFPL